jgi:hypothetical protein
VSRVRVGVQLQPQHAEYAEIGRDPAEIERSAGVQGEPDDVGELLHAAGTRLFMA